MDVPVWDVTVFVRNHDRLLQGRRPRMQWNWSDA